MRVLLRGAAQTQISHGFKARTAEENNVDCAGTPFIRVFTGMPHETKQHKHGVSKLLYGAISSEYHGCFHATETGQEPSKGCVQSKDCF